MRTKRREKRRDRDLKGIVQPTSPAKALWLQTKAGRRDGIEDVMTYAMALAYGGLEAMLQPLASQGTYTDWAERHSERPSTAIAPTHCGQLPGSDPAWHRSTETTMKIPTS